jgi:hypothetical protein
MFPRLKPWAIELNRSAVHSNGYRVIRISFPTAEAVGYKDAVGCSFDNWKTPVIN